VNVQFGFVGDLDESMKNAIEAFAELNLHARIVSTDDPADDVYFNNQVLDTTLLDASAFESGGDISDSVISSSKLQHESLMGMLTVEICGATNLPMQKNMLRTTFNCDPFTVMSFGRKTYKTRLIRHSLNPNWNESCFLHVKKQEYENDYKIHFSVYDYETVSSNDCIGSVEVIATILMQRFPSKSSWE
jgi:phosphatidylserine decarboxylase